MFTGDGAQLLSAPSVPAWCSLHLFLTPLLLPFRVTPSPAAHDITMVVAGDSAREEVRGTPSDLLVLELVRMVVSRRVKRLRCLTPLVFRLAPQQGVSSLVLFL